MQKILITRSDRLGEFLLSLPAIKLIKEQFPESTVYLLAQPENIELIRRVRFIDKFIDYKTESFSGFKGSLRLAAILKQEKINCFIALNPRKEFHLAAYLAGVPLRVGYARKWGWCLNKKIKDKKHLANKHEAEYNLELARLICKDSSLGEVELKVDEKNALNISGSYILLHPFTSHPGKKIDFAFWQQLVKGLKQKKVTDIALIGSKFEAPEAARLAKQWEVADFTGKLSLSHLAALMRYNCKAFIGLDSGPMHLASLLKIPVVGLFTISNPKRWGPYKTKSLIIDSRDTKFCVPTQYFIDQIDKITDFLSRCNSCQKH